MLEIMLGKMGGYCSLSENRGETDGKVGGLCYVVLQGKNACCFGASRGCLVSGLTGVEYRNVGG